MEPLLLQLAALEVALWAEGFTVQGPAGAPRPAAAALRGALNATALGMLAGLLLVVQCTAWLRGQGGINLGGQLQRALLPGTLEHLSVCSVLTGHCCHSCQ